MTDKQIIIDGVDIKDCKRRIGKDNFCRYYKRPCAENNYNCIWKKYLRKEQECEELKKAIDGLLKIQYQLADSCTKYEQTLAEIKEMLKEICMEECSFDWNKTSKKHCGDCDCRYGRILQKISECEVENDR